MIDLWKEFVEFTINQILLDPARIIKKETMIF